MNAKELELLGLFVVTLLAFTDDVDTDTTFEAISEWANSLPSEKKIAATGMIRFARELLGRPAVSVTAE